MTCQEFWYSLIGAAVREMIAGQRKTLFLGGGKLRFVHVHFSVFIQSAMDTCCIMTRVSLVICITLPCQTDSVAEKLEQSYSGSAEYYSLHWWIRIVYPWCIIAILEKESWFMDFFFLIGRQNECHWQFRWSRLPILINVSWSEVSITSF